MKQKYLKKLYTHENNSLNPNPNTI